MNGRAIIAGMQLMQFHTLRSGVQNNASPAGERALAVMADHLRDLLFSCGLFDTVEVEPTDNPDQLVAALCQFRQNVSEEEVALTIERLWDERVSYTFWEAHAIRLDEGFVELEGATRESVVGRYATLHFVATRSQVPLQRGASG